MESVREVRRRDDRSVRVHDREQGRRRHPPVTGLHHADATEPVPFADLEHPRPIGPFPLRLSRGFTHLSRRDMARAFLFGRRMIRETFVHIAGVGYRIEERIWRSGIRTWDDFSAAPRPPRIGQRLARRIEDEVERSAEALRSGRHRYFARQLPSREQWRAFDAVRRHGVYLDIETSGLRGSDAIALWHAYQAGDDDALDLLLTYNLEDAVNLEPLAEFAYEALRSLCLDRGYVTADRYESDGHRAVRLHPSRHEDRAPVS